MATWWHFLLAASLAQHLLLRLLLPAALTLGLPLELYHRDEWRTVTAPPRSGESHRQKGSLVTQLLTIPEAAERLSCSEAAIRKWLSQGRLARVKVGRLTRLRAEEIDEVAKKGLPQASPRRLRVLA